MRNIRRACCIKVHVYDGAGIHLHWVIYFFIFHFLAKISNLLSPPVQYDVVVVEGGRNYKRIQSSTRRPNNTLVLRV